MRFRYNDYSSFLKQEFGEKVQKISVNAGFTCPNRDGRIAKGGCTFCNNESFSPYQTQLELSISDQITKGIAQFERKYPDMKYLAYFQSYTNTYDSIDILKERYNQALEHPRVIGLVVGTRPDCVNKEILDYFEELSKTHKVFIEYGVESCNDKTLLHINRGHDFETSKQAIIETSKRGLHCCAHFILGLPFETKESWLKSIEEINKLPLNSIKFHQLQIVKNTMMEKEFSYSPENFKLFNTAEEYVDLIVSLVERLNPKFVIERFSSSSPKDILITPKWGLKPFEITEKIRKKLIEKDTYQGKIFKQL